MRKFQRAAVVAATIVGLSALGAGVGFANGNDDAAPGITAVANSSANAVAVGGGYYVQPQAQPEGQHEGQPEGQPEEQKHGEPEHEGYGDHEGEHEGE
ncbi:hypothetical protein [Streptomyces sp. NPDC006193]|uniref:hypothetical protein n=1 Tax=Streptomyces sp. NPDC006193 TaxID=3155717 RepID=UPI0033B1BBB7